MLHIEKIENPVPFGHTLFVYSKLYDIRFEHSTAKSRIEKRYLAWETVRLKTNPYFNKGTGFEGYLIGSCQTPTAALDMILSISQHLLDSIAQLYRFQASFQSRLMKTLTEESADTESIHIWSAYLGAELGRLRIQIPHNKVALLFQSQTYAIEANLPPIAYQIRDTTLIQTYSVGYIDNPVAVISPSLAKLDVSENMLNPSQQTAWRVATHIGRFGHPLVRTYLDKVW